MRVQALTDGDVLHKHRDIDLELVNRFVLFSMMTYVYFRVD